MRVRSTKALDRLVLAAVVLLAVGGPTPRASAAQEHTERYSPAFPVVFTQLPTQPDMERLTGRCGGTLRCDYGDGGRIVRLEPDGSLRVLTDGFDSACGADVSFDGERISFAAKRSPGDLWNIWEMQADGGDPRQITRDLGNCRSPAYQATLYTIVSTEPWYQIMFVSDAAGGTNEYGCGVATSLYSCKLDGSAVRRLTLNPSDDFDPFLMDDGRVLLAGWQAMDLPCGDVGCVSLFGVNTDGADYALYCGRAGGRVKHMPCSTTDGLVVFVEADQVGWDGAGLLGCVTTRRPFHSYRPITTDAAVVYHSPSPLPDGSMLVSQRPADGSATHGIVRLEPQTGRVAAVYDDAEYHDIHARALVARRQPDGRSGVVNEDRPTGKLYCLNAYLADPSVQPHMQPGMIRRLRVIEGVSRVIQADPRSSTDDVLPEVQKRLLGVVPVEEDGSFQIELPADVPVQLQTLDENGMALQTCGWIWVKHNEPRGCIGCHEDPELTPENNFVQAVQHPAMKLTLPPDKRRTVNFSRDVGPVIAAKCASCHDSDGPPPNLAGDFMRTYISLLPEKGGYVRSGQARTSPLIWRLFGRNTSRPWDATYDPDASIESHPPAGAEPLTADERSAFVEWIDLGARWGGIEN